MAKDSIRTHAVTDSLRERILTGYYNKSGLPSLRQLTRELNTSLTTIRSAVETLKTEKLLSVSDHMNKVLLHPDFLSNDKANFKVLFLYPVESGEAGSVWCSAIATACQKLNIGISMRTFQGPLDPIILSSLQDVHDLVLFFPPKGLLPGHLSLLKSHKHRVLTLFNDYRQLGVSLVEEFPLSAIDLMLEHLIKKGYRKIHTFQHIDNEVMYQRLDHWQKSCERLNIQTQIHNVCSYKNQGQRLREFAHEFNSNPSTHWPDAMVCFAHVPAMGLQRGFYEIGQLQKGTPKICAIADSDQLHFGTPAITSIRHEPLSIFLMAVIADQKGKKAHRVKFYNPELEIFEDSSHL